MSHSQLVVVVTGAGGKIGYSLLPHLCDGSVFGSSVDILLHLLDVDAALKKLEGVKMELLDCNYPLVKGIFCTSSANDAFVGADVAVLLGGFPRLPGMERRDLIGKNVAIIKEHALAIDSFAKKSVKVLVVANPANTNALVASSIAKSIPARSFTCLTRLDEERLKSFIVEKARAAGHTVSASDVSGVCIFGNHSATQVPSTEAGSINLGTQEAKVSAVVDVDWLEGELVSAVQQRGAAVMNAQGSSSALSAAAAIAKHLRDWIGPRSASDGDFHSMGVLSDANPYGVPEGLWFSFPCERKDPGEENDNSGAGDYEIRPGVELSERSRARLELTIEELMKEKSDAEAFL